MISSRKIFEEIFDYSAQTGPSVILSEPTDVCFCDDNNTINCSQTQLTMTAYPGKMINISVVTVGLKNGVAPATLQIQPRLDKTINREELHKTSAMECTMIQFTALYKHYSLKVDEHKLLNIAFSNCPLGFYVSRKTKPCDCEETLKQTVTNISCDAATSTITRQRGIWIGNISDVRVHCILSFWMQHSTGQLLSRCPDIVLLLINVMIQLWDWALVSSFLKVLCSPGICFTDHQGCWILDPDTPSPLRAWYVKSDITNPDTSLSCYWTVRKCYVSTIYAHPLSNCNVCKVL